MKIEDVRAKNPDFLIKSIKDSEFISYGKVIEDIDFTDYIKYMNKVEIPPEGNVYQVSIIDMEKFKVTKLVESCIYGEMPIEVGFCNGHNRALNGLEYHKGSETIVAVTDLVLMLGKIKDIINNNYNSDNVEMFFVPKGITLELYQTTLHFSPCEVNMDGFKAVIILPKDTNLPLEEQKYMDGNSELLFKKNKWLLVHKSNKRLIEKGAFVGIKGENISLQ
ncbi:DUF4867 family protein [Clostridium sp. DL1XJH146]